MFMILVLFIIETPLSIVEVPPTESACHFTDLKDIVASFSPSIKPSDISVDSQEGKVNDMNAPITMYSRYISHQSNTIQIIIRECTSTLFLGLITPYA